ncbi:MAG: hypothetical protein M1576_01310 [Deltaproteobacteria bacterium]|jgi:copper chaperone CopZ|nr:hypothetical protein [Deltaproteobacteria bacterium]
MKIFKIDVNWMMSESDVNKINGRLSDIHGVKMADAVLKKNAVYIIIENNIDIESVKNIIRNAGYNPELHIIWVIS